MNKILIGCDNVAQYICRETNTVYLTRSMILTFSARDHLRNRGIAVVYGEKPGMPVRPDESEPPVDSPLDPGVPAPGRSEEVETLLEKVIAILRDDHRITDCDTLKHLGLKIISRLDVTLT